MAIKRTPKAWKFKAKKAAPETVTCANPACRKRFPPNKPERYEVPSLMDPTEYLCDVDCYLAWVEDVQMPTTINGHRTPKEKAEPVVKRDQPPPLFDL